MMKVGTPEKLIKTKLDTQVNFTWIVDAMCVYCSDSFGMPRVYKSFESVDYIIKEYVLCRPNDVSCIYGNYASDKFKIGYKNMTMDFLNVVSRGKKVEQSFYVGERKVYMDYFEGIDYGFYGTDYNGALGLGQRVNELRNDAPFFRRENSIIDYLYPKKVITVDLRENKKRMSLGFENTQDTTENILWVKTKPNSFKFDLKYIKIGDETFDLKGTEAVVNPKYENTFIYNEFVRPILVQATGMFFRCIDFKDIPPIVIGVEGGTIEINPGSHLKPGLLSCNSDIVSIGNNIEGSKNTWVFGETILKEYATIYDYENGRIGFAK
ncbi:hypothetical protein BB559_002158 [Furculomyces boomerangus]|uniref:Peptidase A1 domain-containing protein n=1 Tax=Furculomyces boomerangus TaxID=61424 RepID=A0A2T9YXI7_9FUNG|nr:hypothetical protein BB559_002158 [Furculomyces boomerangus]